RGKLVQHAPCAPDRARQIERRLRPRHEAYILQRSYPDQLERVPRRGHQAVLDPARRSDEQHLSPIPFLEFVGDGQRRNYVPARPTARQNGPHEVTINQCHRSARIRAGKAKRNEKPMKIRANPWPFLFPEFRRQGISRSLRVPQDRLHPPPLAIIQQLNAVDAALEGRVRYTATRSVAAENLRDASKALGPVHDGFFVKRFLGKDHTGITNELVDAPCQNGLRAVWPSADFRKTRLRQKQGTEAIPVAPTRGPGNDVIDC